MYRSIAAAAVLALMGCSTTASHGKHTSHVAGEERGDVHGGKIEGNLQQIDHDEAERRKMKIWGQVEKIRKNQHAKLPALTATLTGGKGDPVTAINNQTNTTLTIWFAGECSHQVKIPQGATVTTVFCPGDYNIAAMVDDNAFLPLLREGQVFEAGVNYRLDFFIKKPPK